MINFKKRPELVRLSGEDSDIEVSITEKENKGEKNTFAIFTRYKEDVFYDNYLELTAETLEEAKLLAQDAVEFLKRNKPALCLRKDAVDNKD